MPFGELKFDDDDDELIDEKCEFCGNIGDHAPDCIYLEDFEDVPAPDDDDADAPDDIKL